MIGQWAARWRFGLVLGPALGAVLMVTPTLGCDGLRDGPKGIVRSITDGDTIILDNGLVVRLVGIQAPILALGRPGYTDWPLADQARQALAAIALNKPVLLRYGGEQRDRHGRELAQLFVLGPTETWAQRDMLAQGMARVYSFPDNRACLMDLLAAEAQARMNRLGIWNDPYYRVLPADQPALFSAPAGTFELIEGRVLKAQKSGSSAYLNFGRHWKEDVTAVIEAKGLALFAKAGRDPLALEGDLVRLRGFIEWVDGPRMTVTHPEQIEVLSSK